MDPNITLLQDLAVVMLVAGLVTVLFHRLRQPVVLGYILAGLIVGPHTPPFSFIINQQNIGTLAELGVVFLMFSLGLQFSLRRLIDLGAAAGIAATLEILLMIWIGYQLGQWFGWSQMDSLFLGAALLSSSTIIIVKALNDLGKSNERFAHFIFGIVVFDDMFAIGTIALLSTIALSGSLSMMEVASTAGRMGVFVAAVIVAGLLVVPWVLRYVARFRNDETMLVTVLAMCFGMALLAVQLRYSVALGAFLIGAVMAETAQSTQIKRLIDPLRDMFSAVFFVAVGLMVNPRMIVDHWPVVLAVTVALVLGKTITGALGAMVAGNDLRTSLRVGMGLAQIGEFAFIITQLGLTLNVTSDFLYPVAVSVAALTTLTTPFLIKHSDDIAGRLESITPRHLRQLLDLYHTWMARRHDNTRANQVRPLLRKWALQMGLNLVLVIALFIAAALITQKFSDHWPWNRLPPWTGGVRPALWLAAMIASLPLLIATIRKLRATAMLVAEVSVARTAARQNTPAIRNAIQNIIFSLGLAGLTILIAMLSATLRPSVPVLLVLLVVVGIVAAFLWRSMIKVYAKAQISLRETLAQPPLPQSEPVQLPEQARLITLILTPNSPAVGKPLRNLDLRARSGASIVGIERQDHSIINPDPDQHLQPGDRLILLGELEQVESARKILDYPTRTDE